MAPFIEFTHSNIHRYKHIDRQTDRRTHIKMLEMNRLTFYMIAASAMLLVITQPGSCNNSLSKKLRGLIDRRSRPMAYVPYATYQPTFNTGYYNGGGGGGGSGTAGSSAAAAAAAASQNNGLHEAANPYAHQYVDPYYGHQHNHYMAPMHHEYASEQPHYYAPQVVEQHHSSDSGAASSSASSAGSAAAAAAAASNGGEGDIYEDSASNVGPVAMPTPQQFIPPQPPMPMTLPRHRTRFAAPAAMRVNRAMPTGSGAASSSAASGGAAGGGGAAAAAAASGAGGHDNALPVAPMPVGYEGLNQHLSQDESLHTSYHPGEQVYATSAGTYADNGNGHESSSYLRNTENIVKHEDGREDDNHYYQAQSYGKALDENKHEAYNNADEDIMQTAQMFRKKKTSTNWVSDYNRNQRESGSGVLAKDQHSTAYNKDLHRFVENVDRRHNSDIGGVASSSSAVTSNNYDDEDESYFDSDGVSHAGYAPRRAHGGGAAASSAAGGGRGGSVATSASLNGGASSAAGK